jgi:hypothetical protein
VPSLNAAFLRQPEFSKMQDYPTEKAMKWVKDNVKNGEKILTIRIMTTLFYSNKYGIDRNNIIDFRYDLEEIYTPDKLKRFCISNEVDYITFSYGAVNKLYPIIKYLKENKNNEFIELKKYNIEDNYIIIYKYQG